MAEDILIHRAVHQEIMKFQQTLLRWSIGGMVAIVLSLFGSAGLLGWQNARLVESLRNEIRSEINSLRNEMKAEINRLDARFEDMNRRFEDLKQVVLARRP